MYINKQIKQACEFYKLLLEQDEQETLIYNYKRNTLENYNLLDDNGKQYLFKKFNHFFINDISLYDYLLSGQLNGYSYSGSLFSILAFTKKDLLCRGVLALGENHDFNHGWMEFNHNGHFFILDTTFVGIYPKAIYYKIWSPIDFISISKSDFFMRYINNNYGDIKNNKIKFYNLNNDDDIFRIDNYLKGEMIYKKDKVYKLNGKIDIHL